MAFSLRNNSSHGCAGLDIDGAFIAASQIGSGGIERAASRELKPGVVKDGEVADVAGLAESIRQLFKHNDFPKSVRLGVANQQIVVRHIEMPKIEDRRDRDAAIRFQTAETVAMPLDEAVIDHQLVGESQNTEGAAMERVLVVAARKSMILHLTDAVRQAGLKPEGVDLNAFALVRSLAGQSPPGAEARVYCHLGGVANVAVGLGPSCLFTRPLTADWEGGDGPVEGLAEELRMSIEYYRAQAQAPPVGELVISGPGARVENLPERVGELIGLSVRVAEPLGPFRGASLPGGEDPYRHTVSVGLALGAAA